MKYSTLRLAAAFAISAMAVVSQAQTPIAHWTFDDIDYLNNYDINGGVVNDIQTAGGASNASWVDSNTNDLAYTRGKIGTAVRLRGGGNDWFSITSIPEISNTIALPDVDEPVIGTGITVSAWINSSDGGQSYQGVLMSRDVTSQLSTDPGNDLTGQNWGLAYRNNTNNFDTRVNGQGLSSVGGDVPPNEWHHVAMVWGADQSTVDDFFVPRRIYLDGVEVGFSEDTNVAKLIFSGEWFIGNDQNRGFAGLLDDLAIYDSALTGSQVAAITAAGNGGTNASGTATPDILAGDVNGVGGVTIDDFNIIRDNLGRNVNARNLGDLDGSRKVDLDDFQIWLEVASPALASEALEILSGGSVPEPTGIALAWVALAGIASRRQRKR